MPCALSYYILGCAYMDLHNESQAITAFHEGLSLRCAPSLACAIRSCLANVHETQRKYDEAEACYIAISQTDLSADPQSKKSKRTDIGVILRLGQAQYFQGKRSLALQTFERITNDPYLSTLNQKIPSLVQEQAEHLVQGFRLADINHQIGLAYQFASFSNFLQKKKLFLCCKIPLSALCQAKPHKYKISLHFLLLPSFSNFLQNSQELYCHAQAESYVVKVAPVTHARTLSRTNLSYFSQKQKNNRAKFPF